MNFSEIRFDCRHFRGETPCLPNKLRGKLCPSCDEYDKIRTRILIIKLGAIGDVLRTTPLLHRFRNDFPSPHITWLTHTPEILPKEKIDEVLTFNFSSLYQIQNTEFDIAVNLDKDREACMLLENVKAKRKFGFTWKHNRHSVTSPDAEHKFITGVFDSISVQNTKNYLEEIFEICEMKFSGEEYILPLNEQLSEKWNHLRRRAGRKKIIGLNTGCGKRWQTRLWPDAHWLQLIRKLQREKYFPLLLGGRDEDHKNKTFSRKTKAYYPGTFSLEEFIAICSHCDVFVTAASMLLHIAIGLKKPIVLFNNIFNRNEFYLYHNGVIIEPPTGCDCYYGNFCKRQRHCMNDIAADMVLEEIKKFL